MDVKRATEIRNQGEVVIDKSQLAETTDIGFNYVLEKMDNGQIYKVKKLPGGTIVYTNLLLLI